MSKTGRIESIDELRTFAAIIEAGSLVRASRQLGVTPNAVSRRLSVLEERLGRRLINRTTRRLAVTEEGRQFHLRCRRVLDEIDAAERELLFEDGVRGTLRVGIHADMLGPTLMQALADMLANAPELQVQLHIMRGFADPIAAGFDVAIYVGRPPSSSLMSRSLGTLVWALAAAPSYVAKHGQPSSPEELVDHQCLRLIRDRPETHWKLRCGSGRARRFPIGGRFETDDGRSLTEALYAGIGIGAQLLPEIDTAVAAGTLVRVLAQWQWSSTPVFALMPKGRSKLPRVAAALEALKSTTQQLSRE